MKPIKHLTLSLATITLIILACDVVALAPQTNPTSAQTFNTLVAQTAQAQLFQLTLAAQPTAQPFISPMPIPPTATPSDEALIKQALLAKLGWNEAEMEFSLSRNTGQIAQGSLKKVSEPSGAAWFAGKDANGRWVIAHIGQGVPNCSDIQPYNFPADWISHCMDASGKTVERASAQAAPTEGILPDVYAPNPLGPLFSSMYISTGMCYDMDVLFHTTDASCDVYLDSNSVLNPRNGGLFSGYATLMPPSLNQCKAAQLSADPIAPNSDLYMCFKTNLGKYGFFVARQMDANGIVFDAYVFP